MTTTPFPFQEECVREIDSFNGRALLSLDMGCGKTLVSLLWAKRNFTVRPVLVVCPAGLKWNWANEIKKHQTGLSFEILGGRRAYLPKKKRDVWIINYDVLSYWLEAIRELGPMLVVADECHYARSRTSLRSKALRKVCKGVPCVLALSGTPLVNRPSELFNVLNILRPDLYPNFFHFATEFCRLRRTRWGLDYSGAKNLSKLHRDMKKELLVRRKKEDVLKDLPKKSQHIVTLPIEGRKEYDTAVQDFVLWAKKYAGVPSHEIRNEKIVRIGVIKRLAAELKLPFVIDWVNDFLEETDEKIILFGVHKRVLGALMERYSRISCFVDGSVLGKKRQDQYDEFTHNPGKRIFIGNVDAAGVGWNGNVANNVAFVEHPWTPGQLDQASSRIDRIGQTRPCFVWHLIAHDTIEEDLCETLQRKAKILAHTLDGSKSQSNLDIYDLLEKSLKERRPQ